MPNKCPKCGRFLAEDETHCSCGYKDDVELKTTGGLVGGAILGASIGGLPGAIIGGIIGGILGNEAGKSKQGGNKK
ncbi:MAG: hypothetical protein HY811_08340 [Planctomycetes bacterium]|nr:hypothetical protein [Planctomycetota bacterium]